MNHVSQIKLLVCMMATVLVLNTSQVHAANGLARRSGHPYLTYSDANIARLKERIGTHLWYRSTEASTYRARDWTDTLRHKGD